MIALIGHSHAVKKVVSDKSGGGEALLVRASPPCFFGGAVGI